MERTTVEKARQIFQNNFIGIDELIEISDRMGICIPEIIKKNTPPIFYSEDFLHANKDEYILFLGIPYYKDGTPLTIVKMRDHFGWNPNISEPCFYNQDWYINENFANLCKIELKWYLMRKVMGEETRGISPEMIQKDNNKMFKNLPKALLSVYCFFAWYLLNRGSKLWQNDYLWCSDFDHNMDRIYVGRYIDRNQKNKNGFSIHRFLTVNDSYGIIYQK
jgi:hypothetical protein